MCKSFKNRPNNFAVKHLGQSGGGCGKLLGITGRKNKVVESPQAFYQAPKGWRGFKCLLRLKTGWQTSRNWPGSAQSIVGCHRRQTWLLKTANVEKGNRHLFSSKMDSQMLLVLGAVVVYLIMTLCGLIPVCIVAQKTSPSATSSTSGGGNFSEATERIISLCNCMAGGVFIAMCFLGLLPYSQDKTAAVLRQLNIETDFPVAEFLAVMGFFVMMSIEQVVLVYQKEQTAQSMALWDEPPSQHQDKAGLNYYKTQVEESCSHLLSSVSKQRQQQRLYQNIPMMTFQQCNVDVDDPPVISIDKPTPTFETMSRRQQQQPQARQQPQQHRLTSGFHCSQHVETLIHRRGGLLRLLLLYLAISIHSLFEGMALGLQTDQLHIFHLFFAILFHEALVAFSVGITMARQQLPLSQGVKYILLFSTAVPAGILLGLLIQQVPSTAGSVASAVLQSLATGIFIHVTFLELIPAEFANEKDRLIKVLFHFLGFVALALVTITMGSHH